MQGRGETGDARENLPTSGIALREQQRAAVDELDSLARDRSTSDHTLISPNPSPGVEGGRVRDWRGRKRKRGLRVNWATLERRCHRSGTRTLLARGRRGGIRFPVMHRVLEALRNIPITDLRQRRQPQHPICPAPLTSDSKQQVRVTELKLPATGATMAEQLARSPPTKANRAQYPVGSPEFRKWGSFWTMPLVSGFSRGSPVSPAPSFRRCSIFTLNNCSSALKNFLLRPLAHERNLIYTVQDQDGNTARLARKSDEALGVRVSVVRIAPSRLDLGRSLERRIGEDPTSIPETAVLISGFSIANSGEIQAALNMEVLRADVDEARWVRSSPGMQDNEVTGDPREKPVDQRNRRALLGSP
ncbi:hypothetical protein PR048_018342 [Dryococelus australis]|uniref:Uncharacterized protein n=1 Tax=Dryococelus australis TaxID=614101 RepID=A0ABQ9HCD8_9NEOP|nr:hypothetical protein PR048_018342 [Dryococelus australis]